MRLFKGCLILQIIGVKNIIIITSQMGYQGICFKWCRNWISRRFYLYEAASELRNNDFSVTILPVNKLFVNNNNYNRCGHVLVTDNWHTSIGNLINLTNTANYYIGNCKYQ